MNLFVTDPSTIPAPPPSTDEDLSEFLIPDEPTRGIDIVSEVDRTDEMTAIDVAGLDYDHNFDELEARRFGL